MKKVEAAKVEDARKKAEYDKAKEEREKVEAKNSGDIAKINAENEKIRARNAEKETKYKKELEAFNNAFFNSELYKLTLFSNDITAILVTPLLFLLDKLLLFSLYHKKIDYE